MARSKRKQNYIDNHVQGALLRRILSHWLMFFAVSAFAVILLRTLLGDPSVSLMERLRFQTGEFAFFAIVMLAMFPAFMLDTIRFSNRFVGPIARVRRHLRELSEGDTTVCAFRGDDFWTDLADEFNKVADLVTAQKAEIARLETRRCSLFGCTCHNRRLIVLLNFSLLPLKVTPMKKRISSAPRRQRQGAAVVEFAVCLPVILLVVLGSIEAASMLFLKQALVQASYEGAKVAIRDGDPITMRRAIEEVTDGRRIKNITIKTTPSNIAAAEPGDLISIEITAPGDANSLIPFGPFKNQNVKAAAAMVKE